MDIAIIMNSEITFWFLLVADVVLLAIVFYSVFLFRKETYDLEKQLRDQYEPRKMSAQNRNAVIVAIVVIVFIVFCRVNTMAAYL